MGRAWSDQHRWQTTPGNCCPQRIFCPSRCQLAVLLARPATQPRAPGGGVEVPQGSTRPTVTPTSAQMSLRILGAPCGMTDP